MGRIKWPPHLTFMKVMIQIGKPTSFINVMNLNALKQSCK